VARRCHRRGDAATVPARRSDCGAAAAGGCGVICKQPAPPSNLGLATAVVAAAGCSRGRPAAAGRAGLALHTRNVSLFLLEPCR